MRPWLVVMLVAMIGCGAAAKPETPPPPLTADAIYRRMLDVYERATTYADAGRVETAFTGARPRTTETHFTTRYVRGRVFRLAFADDVGDAIVWSDGLHTYARASYDTTITDYHANLALALGAFAGVSHTVSVRVPRMLLHGRPVPSRVELVGSDGSDWHLRIQERVPVDLWIHRDSYLIHRVESRHAVPADGQRAAFEVHQSIIYDAVIGPAIPDAELRAPALDKPVAEDHEPAWLGIRTEDTPARVSQVVPGAPADKAGVQIGDEVVSIDGAPISDAKAVVEHAAQLTPKKPTPVVVRRKGVEVPLTVTPEMRPDAAKVQATFVGKPAPALSVAALAGGPPITLAVGQATVLDFWATWCGPCAILSPHLEELANKFPTLRVIGISDEDAPDVVAYLARHKVSYTMALDPGDRATKDYLVQGLPTVIVIDKTGVVRYATVGILSFAELDAAVAAAVR